MRQIVDVVGLDGVLIMRAAAASADAQILRRLQKRRSDRQAVHLGPQAVDHVHRRGLAHTRISDPPCNFLPSGLSAMNMKPPLPLAGVSH